MFQFARGLTLVFLVAGGVLIAGARTDNAMAQSFCMLAEVKLFAGTFAPRGWLLANGQILPISQNQALYSLLGTTYGGDGRTSFAVPDLRGRILVGAGQVNGLTKRVLGQRFGTESVALALENLSQHTHTASTTATIKATASTANTSTASGNVLARARTDNIYNGKTPTVNMSANAIEATTTTSATGGGQIAIVQPSLGLNYIICIGGLFPSRP